MRFEWDPGKNDSNLRKHGISLEQATKLFRNDEDILEVYDNEHSAGEDRFIAIGRLGDEVVVVVFTEPAEDTIRLISARPAGKAERVRFETYWREYHER